MFENYLQCLRCSHIWMPRNKKALVAIQNGTEVKIKNCPKCISPYWNKPKKNRGWGVKKECSIKECEKLAEAKGFCHTHYEYYRRKPKHRMKDSKECKAIDCSIKVLRFDYCWIHRKKIEKYGDANINLTGWNKGKNNPNWNGGVSEYPNHCQMKKIRLKKLELVGNYCEECGIIKESSKLQLHHIDGSKDNHTLENFLLLCPKCHKGIYHKGPYGPQKGKISYSKSYLRQNPQLLNYTEKKI